VILKKWMDGESRPTLVCVLISAAALVLSLGGWLRLPWDPAWAAVLLCGAPIVAGAARALVREHNIKADLLVSLALIASLIIREYFAAGEVALIMQVGTLLEDHTAGRARQGIEKLVKLTPRTARVRRDGREMVVPAEEVEAGDELTVLAGETVPADGVVLSGEAAVDQSAMTGESLPADKKAGDKVTSGTVSCCGAFTMRAERACADSSLQRMIRLARQADAGRAPVVALADRWATWMVLCAVSVAVITGLVTRQPIRAVTVLVVFCPCAFVLATPTAIMAGIANAARYGILIRSGDALERLAGVKAAAFDKTGTLTLGHPAVTAVEPLLPSCGPERLLRLAALAEQRSEHPLGKAVVARYLAGGGTPAEVSEFQMFPGRGVRACAEGCRVAAGKQGFLEEQGVAVPPEAVRRAEEHAARGETLIWVALDGRLGGFLALGDAVRPEAVAAVAQLGELGIQTLLLTGDHAGAAAAAAAQAGIGAVRADLLPEDKMAAVEAYGRQGLPVCMVGDGVNDALALRTASAGVAMGGVGSDIAVESSDAVLVSDDLRRLPYLFRLTRRVMGKVRQNIVISLCINLAAVTLSVLGLLNPVTGALLHNCGSVFVVLNAALLLRDRPA